MFGVGAKKGRDVSIFVSARVPFFSSWLLLRRRSWDVQARRGFYTDLLFLKKTNEWHLVGGGAVRHVRDSDVNRTSPALMMMMFPTARHVDVWVMRYVGISWLKLQRRNWCVSPIHWKESNLKN